jgi:hypothetical protein
MRGLRNKRHPTVSRTQWGVSGAGIPPLKPDSPCPQQAAQAIRLNAFFCSSRRVLSGGLMPMGIRRFQKIVIVGVEKATATCQTVGRPQGYAPCISS